MSDPKPAKTGSVIWITGISGVGKSTFSRELVSRLRRETDAVVVLDGDAFREVMGNDLGYDREDRLRNALRLSRFAALLASQGIHVVCATMSLFRECHEWNRGNITRYREVLIRADPVTLEKRDHKGLRSAYHAGQGSQLVGLDQTYDEPTDPEHVFANDGDLETFLERTEEVLLAWRAWRRQDP